MSSAPSSGFLARGAVSQRHAQFLRTLRLRQTWVVVVQLAVMAAFLGFWQLAADWRIIDPFITSQPTAVIQKLLELTNDGSLGYHVTITVAETLAGFGYRHRRGNSDRGDAVVVGFPERCGRPLHRGAQRHAEDGAGAHLHHLAGSHDDGGDRARGLDLAVRHDTFGLQRVPAGRPREADRGLLVRSVEVAAIQQGRLSFGGADDHRDAQSEYRSVPHRRDRR